VRSSTTVDWIVLADDRQLVRDDDDGHEGY
jgi:hypothetical protein